MEEEEEEEVLIRASAATAVNQYDNDYDSDYDYENDSRWGGETDVRQGQHRDLGSNW